jgi:UDP-N-acetylglucosamine 2-epimerase
MRNETEWIETVNEGWNTLVGADKEKIIKAVNSFSPPDLRPPLYGLGAAAEKCVELIGSQFGSQSVVFTRTVGPFNAR